MKKLLRCLPQLVVIEGVLYRKANIGGEEVTQLLLPACFREKVMVAWHDEAGHQGIERTVQLLRAVVDVKM